MEKQVLILLHGALGSQTQLESLKRELDATFRVYTFDFEGHGKNTSSGDFTMLNFAQNLQDFISENSIETSNLFGYSMGGYVALTFARNHPEKVGKIITLGTRFHWTPESAAQETRKLNPEKIEEKVPAFANSLAALHGKSNWKSVVSQTAEMMSGLGNGLAFTPADFAEIGANTLLLLAEHDEMVTLAETELVQIALQNAEFQIVHDAKHPLETANPKALAEKITDFIID